MLKERKANSNESNTSSTRQFALRRCLQIPPGAYSFDSVRFLSQLTVGHCTKYCFDFTLSLCYATLNLKLEETKGEFRVREDVTTRKISALSLAAPLRPETAGRVPKAGLRRPPFDRAFFRKKRAKALARSCAHRIAHAGETSIARVIFGGIKP